MSERYTRVFSLPANLYATGAPVVISAGALLKDNQTGAILAQLKMRNISPKPIIGVRIRLRLFDNFKTVLGEPVEYEYLDLHADRDAEFGQKYPILIPEARARLYKVSITGVVFKDRSIWNANNEVWKPLGNPAYLNFQDPELQKQYKLQFGPNSMYKPMIDRDLWYCTCGALNHRDEICHKCSNSLASLQAIDMSELIAGKDARLAREAAERAAKIAQQEAAAAAAKQKKEDMQKAVVSAISTPIVAAKHKGEAVAEAAKQKKKAAAEAAQQKKEAVAAARKLKEETSAAKKQNKVKTRKPVLIILCAALVVPLLCYTLAPTIKYQTACFLMEAEQYERAISVFETMDSYKDSVQKIDLCREGIKEAAYQNALALMEQGAYADAIVAFQELGNYKDCAQQISLCEEASTYLTALKLLEANDFEEAKKMLEKIESYKDSADLIQLCNKELGPIKKEEGLKLMEPTHYNRALALLEEAEACGIDCDAEIRECEIAMLDDTFLKRYQRLKPYITRGEPINKESKLFYTTDGDVTVYSITRVDLDNGCVRFSVDYIPPKSSGVFIFNPPNGTIFTFWDEKDPTQERKTLVFDILKKDVQAAGSMTFNFPTTGPTDLSDFIYVRNLY